MKTKNDLAPIFILIATLLISGIAGGAYYAEQNQKTFLDYPYPTLQISSTIYPSVSSVMSSTANWKTYTNTKYGFSLKVPSDFKIDENTPEYGWLGNQIYYSVTDLNPAECRGDCPIIKSLQNVKTAGLEAIKLEGSVGQYIVPQSYISYTFTKEKYITFILYELDKDTTLKASWERKPKVINNENTNLFNLILSTFRLTK